MENTNYKLIESLQEQNLIGTVYPNAMTWEDYLTKVAEVSHDDVELKKLINIKKQEELIAAVSFKDILTASFPNAKQAIDQMTLNKRLEVLEELQHYRSYLYESIQLYGEKGVSRDERISDAHFRKVIGKIKHVEILQNWLFGII